MRALTTSCVFVDYVGSLCRRSRPVGLCVDPSDADHDVWSLLDPLSVVCCRLQTLVEARSDGGGGRAVGGAGGDVRWQAGLLASLGRATQRLQVLASSTTAAAATRDVATTSFTVSCPAALLVFVTPLHIITGCAVAPATC